MVDIRGMAWQDQQRPWWERPAKAPGEPQYEPEREHLRAELARARRADAIANRGRDSQPRRADAIANRGRDGRSRCAPGTPRATA